MGKTLKFTDMFQKSCTKYYSKTCVMYYEDATVKKITYSEICGIFHYIYTLLNSRNIYKQEVGLCMKQNPLIPAIIAAIHRCESSFMFLDTQDVQGIAKLTDLGIPYAITVRESNSLNNFGFPHESELMVSILGFTFQLYNININNEIFLGYDHGKIAYHVQTSGSTGSPKTIAVPHECISPNVEDFKNLFNLSERDVIFFSTPLTFDPSMVELYLVIYTGCSLFIAPDNLEVLFPFGDSLDYAITFWQTTPSKLNMWSNSELHNIILGVNSSLRVLLIGGEECQSVVKRIRQERHPDNKTLIFNVYGVTEMSCWASISEIECTSDSKVSIGKCLSETEVKIFNESGKLLNTGTGQIKIGSKTRKCIFDRNKLEQQRNDIVWIDTGDLGEIDKYGQIFFIGRSDYIIKRFGFKVNLHHIEMAGLALPYINQCAGIWKGDKNMLILFFTLNDDNVGDLLEDIKRRLRQEEWPDEVHHIECMPLNHHGKICKRSLGKIYDDLTGSSGRLDIQHYFISELLDLLGKNSSGLENKLFESSYIDLGGNSFSAITLVNKLEQFSKLKFPKLLLSLMDSNTSIQTCLKILVKGKRVNIETSSFKISSNKKRPIENEEYEHFKLSKNNENTVPDLSISWKYNLGKCVDSRPSVFTKFDGETIIAIGSHSGFIAILNAESGAENGLLNVMSRVEAPIHCKRVVTLLKDCGVVGCYDGSLWCFCLHTSEVLWKIDLNSMVKSEVSSSQSSLFVASYDALIRIINFENGLILQSIKVGNGGISADLLLCEDAKMVFIGTLSGICASLDIQLQTVEIKWEVNKESPIFVKPAMLVVPSHVLFAEVNGKIHCLKSSSGETVWTFSEIQGNIFSSIFVEQNLMYFGCHNENVYCLTGMKDIAILKWKLKLKGKIHVSPNAHEQHLLVASHLGNIYTINKENLNFTVTTLPAEIFSTPVIYENAAYVGCRDDHVYSLKIKQII